MTDGPPRSDGTAVVVLDGPFDATQDPVFGCKIPQPSSRCGRVALTKSFSPSPLAELVHSFRHATLVAAAVAAAAPHTDIIAFNVYDQDSNFGTYPRLDAVLAALSWVRDHARDYGIVAVNVSFGFPDKSPGRCDDDDLAVAIRATREAGVAVVAAAGNSGRTDFVARPACVTAATSVGAVDGSARRRPGDGAGPVLATFTNRHALLDLFAEGTHVPAGGERSDGTSFSAALVSAAIARIQVATLAHGEPRMSVDDVEEALRMHSLVSTDGPRGDDLRHFLALDEHASRAYVATASFAFSPAENGRIVGRALVQTAEADTVQGMFLSMEVQTPFPDTVPVVIRSPRGREIQIRLPRTETAHRYSGGDFNGIIDETETPNPFSPFHGEPLNGEWTIELGAGVETTLVHRARLYLR